MLRPTNELVAVAWLKGVDTLPVGQIGTTLPEDESKYPNGFVQVLGVGGDSNPSNPMRRPVVRVSCWMPAAAKPRYGEANDLAERVVSATYGADGHGQTGRRVTPGTGKHADAHVHAVFPVGIPLRVNDPNGFARYDVDLEVRWTPLASY